MATIAHRRDPPKTPFHNLSTTRNSHPNTLPSSSPAFATPIHPIRARNEAQSNQQIVAPILPVLLPAAILRPLAFRTFTKKHNLTLTTNALNLLASFIGKHCGSGWREEGLAEGVLEEVARMWRREKGDGEVIVDGEKGDALKGILKILEGCMVGGRVVLTRKSGILSRQTSMVGGGGDGLGLQREESFGTSGLDVSENNDDDEADAGRDVRRWLKVVDAFEQPRMVYNATKKHFEKSKFTSSFFPSPAQKTDLFRQHYHIIHQRVLRNEAFQRSSNSNVRNTSNDFRITPIVNLLGRSGTPHLLLGLLAISPTGTLALNDPTGSIALDIEQATSIEGDPASSCLCPGMIVLVDGVYEEEFNSAGGGGILGSVGGIGGTIGGRFLGLTIGAPRCETRAATLGLTDNLRGSSGSAGNEMHIGGGFGWVDFLGVGSERGFGSRMRKIEQRILHNTHASVTSLPRELEFEQDKPEQLQAPIDHRTNSSKIVVLGEVNLDDPRALSALRKVLLSYTQSSASNNSFPDPPPLAFILLGNFVSRAALSDTTTTRSSSHSTSHNASTSTIADSITYKEHFDALALLLSDFPHLLRSSTWLFVPGDNDPWASSFSAGAAVPLPRSPVPEMFTSRVRRAFASANADVAAARERGASNSGKDQRVAGEAVWTTNPSRLSLFGPNHEIVVFRDDVSGRLRRNAIPLKNSANSTVDDDLNEEQEEINHNAQADIDDEPDLEAMDVDVQSEATTNPLTAATKPAKLSNSNARTSTSAPSSTARTLTKTLLDQSHLSPFPLTVRPQHWSYAHALGLYPLPTALVLCDAETEAFACVYQGCCVVNAGRLVNGAAIGGGGDRGGERGTDGVGRGEVSWVEVDVVEGRGLVKRIES